VSRSWEVENAALEEKSPRDRLAWAVERFGEKLLFTSSFGAGAGVLLHLWSEVARELPVVFLDTNFHFPETLEYRDRLVEQLGLRLEIVRPRWPSREAFLAEQGELYLIDPDACCALNKVDPLAPRRSAAAAWISGLRRDQSKTRASTPILLEEEGGPLKVHPIATMTARDVDAYLAAHGIPEHPLKARRFLSIGCAPCTRPVADGEDERAGRWSGTAKTECGLHLPVAGAASDERARR
jgi:phosphoadenosine phosphosulfate reductase